MRPLTCLLLLPVLSFAQVPHTFNNGEVADADKINQNFNYVLENASGGCSATQQDNIVRIECADGSSGVLAGAGTVVLLPEATIGEIPDVSGLPQGNILIFDGEDRALGRYSRTLSLNRLEAFIESDLGEIIYFQVQNDDDAGSSSLFLYRRDIYYSELDCGGYAFSNGQDIDPRLLYTNPAGDVFSEGEPYPADLITKSYHFYGSSWNCTNLERPWLEYQLEITAPVILPDEIRNPVYPVYPVSYRQTE